MSSAAAPSPRLAGAPRTPVTLARHAMATRFELVLHGENPTALRAAGEEALDEIDRLENQLSRYRPGSEIAQLNARAARETVRVTPELFALLEHAQRLHTETDGAFDITIGPLVRCWGFMDRQRRAPADLSAQSDERNRAGADARETPTNEAVAAARASVGMQHVRLDPTHRTVRFAREGVMLDLGAIGKGYAVERAAEVLRAAGVTSALIHGGTSTVYAMGTSPDGGAWKVALEKPSALAGISPFPELPTLALRDEALSVSAIWGRGFQAGEKTYGHVLDPRTGWPVDHTLLAMVVLPSATETDALSTALLALGRAGHNAIAGLRPGMKTLLVSRTEGGPRAESHGFESWPVTVSPP